MPSSLRNRLNELAASFSASVLDAVRGASLEELLSESSGGKSRTPARAPVRSAARSGARVVPVAPAASPAPRRRPGRLPRRSAGDISQAVEKIVGLLSDHPAGLRAEQIRQKLGLQAKELPRPLKEGLEGGRLSKVGRKRATTYFAGAGSSGASKRRKPAAGAPRAGRGRARAAKAGGAQAKKRRRSKGSKGKAAKG